MPWVSYFLFKQTYVNNNLQDRNNMGKILISELLFGVEEVYLHYVSLHQGDMLVLGKYPHL